MVTLTATDAVSLPFPGALPLLLSFPPRRSADLPVTDRLRIITRGLQNFVVDPSTGSVNSTSASHRHNDPAPGTPRVTTVAYANATGGTTTLFGVDQTTGKLVTVGSPGGSPLAAS